jgi:hypothetical protein
MLECLGEFDTSFGGRRYGSINYGWENKELDYLRRIYSGLDVFWKSDSV